MQFTNNVVHAGAIQNVTSYKWSQRVAQGGNCSSRPCYKFFDNNLRSFLDLALASNLISFYSRYYRFQCRAIQNLTLTWSSSFLHWKYLQALRNQIIFVVRSILQNTRISSWISLVCSALNLRQNDLTFLWSCDWTLYDFGNPISLIWLYWIELFLCI